MQHSEPDCKSDFATGVVQELFSGDSQSIPGVFGVQCNTFAGTVNGFTAGSSFDIDQEKADRAKGWRFRCKQGSP
jgi:hypothetical protein